MNLENLDVRKFAEDDPNGFLKQYGKYVIFDEAQRVPQLFSYLQTKVDEDKIMGQCILSGSQNFHLMQNITQSLAGRVALFKLLPFDVSEMDAANWLNEDYAVNLQKDFILQSMIEIFHQKFFILIIYKRMLNVICRNSFM